MKASHQVVESRASIGRLTTDAAATKKQKEIGELVEILSAAKEKLAAKKGVVSALYKTEICALLVVCYSIHPDKEIGELVEILPAAKEKLAAKKGVMSALYKTEICALLVVCYSIHPDVAKDLLSKPTLASMLVERMESNPDAVLAAAPAP
jgi:hypothetical protein